MNLTEISIKKFSPKLQIKFKYISDQSSSEEKRLSLLFNCRMLLFFFKNIDFKSVVIGIFKLI